MTSVTTAPQPERQSARWLPPLVWMALTIGLAVTVPELPWQRVVEELKHLDVAWPAAALVANAFILPLWATEWRLLVPGAFRVTYGRMFEVVSVTAAVLNSVPFFAGEVSGVALLIGRAGLSRGAALSVLAMDQLLVGFAKLAVVGVAAIYVPLPVWLRAGILSLVVGVAALLAALFPLALRWRPIQDRLLARPSRLRALAARLIAWGEHLDALREPGRVTRLALLALGKKGAELIAIIAIQTAFGLDPTLAGALLVLAALAITTLLPIAPANLGIYEATVFATYRFLDVPAETAIGIAIVQHLCFLLPPLVIGYGLLTLQPLWSRRPRES